MILNHTTVKLLLRLISSKIKDFILEFQKIKKLIEISENFQKETFIVSWLRKRSLFAHKTEIIYQKNFNKKFEKISSKTD